MSGFSSFALFGVGRLGYHILSSLLAHRAASSITIRILTRPGSPRPQSLPSNVSFWPIDYSNDALADQQLAQALNGIEVVISSVGWGLKHNDEAAIYAAAGKTIADTPGFVSQRRVAIAAKRAGCQLFVPAEYGSITHVLNSATGGFVLGKKLIQDELLRLKLPWMIIYSGLFPPVEPTWTALPSNTTALVPSPYETTRNHLAQFIAHLVLDLPQENLEWGIFMIRGCRREALEGGRWVVGRAL